MPEPVQLLLAMIAGVGLSVPMFAGLWWTLRRLPDVRRPAMFALASFWLRLAVVVVGFYFITANDWQRGLAALMGFLIGRTLLLRWLGRPNTMVSAKGA